MRFVILEHDHPVLHWDLMLEAGGVLQTWRLAEMPALGKQIEATALGDHRLAYLDYEGPVSGGRGTVRRWDAGTFEESATEDGRALLLEGQRVRAHVWLVQVKDERWRFVWMDVG